MEDMDVIQPENSCTEVVDHDQYWAPLVSCMKVLYYLDIIVSKIRVQK